MSLKLQIVSEIGAEVYPLPNQKNMAYKLDPVVQWLRNLVALIGKTNILSLQSPRTKIMDLKPSKATGETNHS
jgi:hypothetical protein